MAPTTSGPTKLCESPPPFVTITDDGTASLIVLVFSWNRGKGRKVYQRVMRRGMKVHRSVKTRMLAGGVEGKHGHYLPRIRCVIDGTVRSLTKEEWMADEPEHFEWVD